MPRTATPRFWDSRCETWTQDGLNYLEKLGRMSGARRKRFLEGIWAAAEGLVYDNYQPSIHNLPASWKPPHQWRRVWSIDWGFTAPLCLQMWAIDDDCRMYLYREVYKTQYRVEHLAKWCKKLIDECEEPRPMAIVTDHDPEAQATFRQHSSLGCTSAWKEDKYAGIEQMQSRFDVAGDGKPRIFFVPDARCHPEDTSLSETGKPACTLEELPGYVWNTTIPDKPKEEPLHINSHGADAARYCVVYCDRLVGTGSGYSTGHVSDTIHGDIRNQHF